MKAETVRAYVTEPVVSAMILSLCLNCFGRAANVDFMHDEARDILSLNVVLLGAALALWIGLFWIANTDFGRWLSSKQMLERINSSYVTSAIVLLVSCVLCIICAHVQPSHSQIHMSGEFFFVWGLCSMPVLLNNTRHLLRLHGQFGRRLQSVMEVSAAPK